MKVAVIGGLADSLLNFRGELLRAMVSNGHDVLAIAPEADAHVEETLGRMGVTYVSVPFERAGLNPVKDAAALVRLVRHLRAFRPDLVLAYTAKPVVYGILAARLAAVPRRVALITGTGSALGAVEGGPRRLLSRIVKALYSLALKHTDVVFFQNPDDEATFRGLGLVGPRHRVHLVNGSGVDLAHFTPAPLPPGPITFLMIARLLRDKGVLEYVEAARCVRERHPHVRFQLLGPLDPNPSAVTAADLESWRREGVVEYLGVTRDVRPFLARAHVFVLPSYAEGTPRSALEAMATGRPIVTTDAPGCRETVQNGRNGLLVRPRDANDLALGLERVLAHSDHLERMAQQSRLIAEERFDVHAVNRSMLGAMDLLPYGTQASPSAA